MISIISSFEIINYFIPYPNIFLWTAASATDAAAVNLDDIKTLSVNGLSTFPIKDKLCFSNRSKSLPKNSPSCPIFYNWVF